MKSKAIVPTRIEVEERSDTEILVVEDGNKDQYTTPDPYLVNWTEKHSDMIDDKYIGQKWKIAFTVTDDGYRDFEGFLSKVVQDSGQDSLDARVDQLEQVVAEVETDVKSMKDLLMEMVDNE